MFISQTLRSKTTLMTQFNVSNSAFIPLNNLKYMPVYLNALESVSQFAKDIMQATDRLDFLINNAAVSHGPYRTTVDNFESTMGVGHLAHYYLTELLRPLLLRTRPGAKIIIISSAEHTGGSFINRGFFIERDKFNSVKALAQVKLANVIHGIILAERFKGTSVIPVSIHPGYVVPNFGMFIPSLFGAFFKTHWEAGQAVLHAALTPDLQPGGYYVNCRLTEPAAEAKNAKVIRLVKTESERLINYHT
uniref:Retinol dehydrogenase 12 n=1 Tax=Mesocestoides corti TaxID=53468 RepID=A0A5K3FN81_MESCO